MARRDLEVRVRADVGAYQKAMSGAVKSTDQLGQAGLRIQKVGLGMSRLGDSLTKSVTLPLVAVGAAATKMALDFDKSFVQMQTLAGVSADAVGGLKDSVLDLAGETGRSPRELADALYFLQSAGLDSEQAMDALKVSAKASAIGLGETEVVADAVSSAMLAYAKSGLSAAEATDVLIATARAGKAEPAELAAQMGRLLPIASELGITFGDVGGAIAALSTRGNDAAAATTQLSNVMAKLLKPSQQAEQALEDVGLSTDMIRQMIREKGLLGTLEELKARLGESGFVKYFEDVQAVQGALSLLGGDLDQTRQIFDDVNNSVGATDSAFATWAESMGAENARAFADFQVAMIHLGDVIAPLATDVISAISGIAEAFSDLPDGVQQAIIYIGLFAAAIGPLLSIGGRVVTMVGTLVRLLPSLAVPTGTVAGAFNGAAVSTSRFSSALGALTKATLVVGALIALREVLGTIDDEIDRASLSELENQLLDLAETGEASGDTLNRVFEGWKNRDPGAGQMASDLKLLDEALAKLALRDPEAAAAAFERINDALQDEGVSASQVKDAFDEYRGAVAEADTASRTAKGGFEDADAAMAELGLETETTTSALQDYIDTLRGMFDPQFAMIDAMQSSAEAQQELRDSKKELDEALASGDVERITEAQERYDTAVGESRRSVVDLQVAANELKDSMEEQGLSADEVTRKFVKMATEQGFSTEEALIMAEAFGLATEKSDELGATDPNVEVSQTGSARVRGDLSDVQQAAINAGRQKPNVHVTTTGVGSAITQLNRIPRRIDTTVHVGMVRGHQTVSGMMGGPTMHEGGIVPGPRGQEVAAILQAGEHVTSLADMDSMRTMPAGQFGGGAGVTYVDQRTIQYHIAGQDPQGTVEAIKRYERMNGSGWRS